MNTVITTRPGILSPLRNLFKAWHESQSLRFLVTVTDSNSAFVAIGILRELRQHCGRLLLVTVADG